MFPTNGRKIRKTIRCVCVARTKRLFIGPNVSRSSVRRRCPLANVGKSECMNVVRTGRSCLQEGTSVLFLTERSRVADRATSVRPSEGGIGLLVLCRVDDHFRAQYRTYGVHLRSGIVTASVWRQEAYKDNFRVRV